MDRHLALSLCVALLGCDPGERASVARVQQATLDDGRADAVFGQIDLTSGAEPATPAANTTSQPTGLALDVTLPATVTTTYLWIADRNANRVLGVLTTDLYATYLIGQPSFLSGEPNAGGAVSAATLNQPAAVAYAFGNALAIADTGNHRVLLGNPHSDFPWVVSGVLGQQGRYDTAIRNHAPVDAPGISGATLAEPSGVAFEGPEAPGRLLVADTGNHRVLVFSMSPPVSTTAMQCVGQPTCSTGDPNYGGAVSAFTMHTPRGIATYNVVGDPLRGYYVADSGNHRVLHFATFSTKPDLVYGQGGDFTTNTPSKGGVSATSLRDPTAVAVAPDGSLYIADTGHHRVLHFPKGSTIADRVYGQPDFTTATPPTSPTATTMRAPSGLAVTSGELFVADSGWSRVLRFRKPCDAKACDDGDPCTDDTCTPTGCAHGTTTFSKDCAPYTCDLARRACRRPCTGPGTCQTGFECINGVCAALCTSDSDCAALGFACHDGFCCDRPCRGPCESCNVPGAQGTCTIALAGRPPTGRSCGASAGDCGAQCSGFDGTKCYAALEGTPCGVESCVNGVASVRGTCSADGTCSAKEQKCAPFGCDVNGCRTSCRFNFDCAEGASCSAGVCVEGLGARAGGGCVVGRSNAGPAVLVFVAAMLASLARRRR